MIAPRSYQAGAVVRGYAAVVLATPLERSGGLRLHGVGPLPRLRSYQRTVTTFVRGRLDPAWFGVARLPGEPRLFWGRLSSAGSALMH